MFGTEIFAGFTGLLSESSVVADERSGVTDAVAAVLGTAATFLGLLWAAPAGLLLLFGAPLGYPLPFDCEAPPGSTLVIAPVTWLIVWLICPGTPLNRFGKLMPGVEAPPLVGVPLAAGAPVADVPESPEELELEPALLLLPPALLLLPPALLVPPAEFDEEPDLPPDELDDPPLLPFPLCGVA